MTPLAPRDGAVRSPGPLCWPFSAVRGGLVRLAWSRSDSRGCGSGGRRPDRLSAVRGPGARRNCVSSSDLGALVLFAACSAAELRPNPAPTLFYFVLVGLTPLSVLFGPLWLLLNPFRALATYAATVLARVRCGSCRRGWAWPPGSLFASCG